MPIKRETVGTGLTKFKRERISGRGEKEKAAIGRIVNRHNKTRGSFDAMAAPIERTAKAILKKAAGKPGAIQSQPWYADKILFLIGATRVHIKKNEAELAAMRALELGHFHYEALFKDVWERHTKAGFGTSRGGYRSAETRRFERDLKNEVRRTKVNEYLAQGLSIGKAKERAARNLGCSIRTISRARDDKSNTT